MSNGLTHQAMKVMYAFNAGYEPTTGFRGNPYMRRPNP